MSLWDLFRRWFWPRPEEPSPDSATSPRRSAPRKPRRRARLVPLRWRAARRKDSRASRLARTEVVAQPPYAYARPCVVGGFLDHSGDGDDSRLRQYGLPVFRTPQELADWLQVPLGRLAWLVHRFDEDHRPADIRTAHYHFRWLDKRSGGKRLIESPKPRLKAVQQRILREILDHVPAHPAAHGFVMGRSIRSNALPHVRQRVVVKLDLENFYPSVSFSRVVAIFRSLGYSREAANWLGRLATSALPEEIRKQSDAGAVAPYLHRHLPQGAATSPALANLSAFSLDLRLAGLARSFGANYTRYADDLTFSGDERFLKSLAVFLPLVSQIVGSTRFRVNKTKRRVIRNGQRQQIAGVVVNERLNVARRDYDVLKAILVNCIRRGPSTQNHTRHEDFPAHLRGRIAHVSHLNPERGAKLLALYARIDWRV